MKSHLELFLTYFFFLGALVPGFFAFFDWDRRKARGAPIPPSKFTKRLVTGWTIYLCIAAIASGAGAYYDSKRVQSQPSPTSELPTSEASTLETPTPFTGRKYTIGHGSWKGIDPAIKRRLADSRDSSNTAGIMSIEFVNEKEVELVYLGETYNGRFTTGGSSVAIKIDGPAFPGGLSGEHFTESVRPALEYDPVTRRPPLSAIWFDGLTLRSKKFTYLLVGD